jgi:hypothetical protein
LLGDLHENSNDNGFIEMIFATSKNVTVKRKTLPRHNIHKHTWTSPDGKIHNEIDPILIEKRRHSNVFDVRSCRGADCETDHYLVVAKVRQRLSVSKRAPRNFDLISTS